LFSTPARKFLRPRPLPHPDPLTGAGRANKAIEPSDRTMLRAPSRPLRQCVSLTLRLPRSTRSLLNTTAAGPMDSSWNECIWDGGMRQTLIKPLLSWRLNQDKPENRYRVPVALANSCQLEHLVPGTDFLVCPGFYNQYFAR